MTPTPQQIIELAREAGFALGFSSPALEKHQRFATLLLERFGQAPAVQQEPVAWESTTPTFEKYITQSRYEKFKPGAQRWYKPYRCTACTHPAPAEVRGPLTDAQIEAGRQRVFSTNNPFCPCDSKTMRKAVQWAERAHGITGSKT